MSRKSMPRIRIKVSTHNGEGMENVFLLKCLRRRCHQGVPKMEG